LIFFEIGIAVVTVALTVAPVPALSVYALTVAHVSALVAVALI
jgi:hypothetical protein